MRQTHINKHMNTIAAKTEKTWKQFFLLFTFTLRIIYLQHGIATQYTHLERFRSRLPAIRRYTNVLTFTFTAVRESVYATAFAYCLSG